MQDFATLHNQYLKQKLEPFFYRSLKTHYINYNLRKFMIRNLIINVLSLKYYEIGFAYFSEIFANQYQWSIRDPVFFNVC